MSEFGGLQIALSSLYAQRRAMEITGHNVSNANTAGYSRQSVQLEAITGARTAGVWSGHSLTGQGVQISGYNRYRDVFLEAQAALEHGAQSHLTQAKGALGQIEGLFAEPSDQSIAKSLSDYWTSWGDLANHPDDNASRAQVLERATTVAVTFNHASQQLAQYKTDTMSQLGATVASVNTSAATLASLNDSIRSATNSGLNASDLMDQRDVLAQQLATDIGATVRQMPDGSVNVYVNGTPLVTQNRAETLQLDTTGGTATIRWARDGYPATITSGTAGGQLEAINVTIPKYSTQLDAVANQLRDEVNTLHAAIGGSLATTAQDQSAAGNLSVQVGLDGGAMATINLAGANWSGAGGAAALQTALQNAINGAVGTGNATVTVTGGNGTPMSVSVTGAGGHTLQVQGVTGNAGFATLLGSTPVGSDGVGGRQFWSGTGANDLAVSSDIGTNTANIAAGAAGGGALDGSVALGLADLGGLANGADEQYRGLIVGLGVDSQNVSRRYDIQTATVAQVDGARDSYSGVNTDEEMVAMVQYQHAYDAAARFLTAVDQMLDTLVHSTGMAGR